MLLESIQSPSIRVCWRGQIWNPGVISAWISAVAALEIFASQQWMELIL